MNLHVRPLLSPTRDTRVSRRRRQAAAEPQLIDEISCQMPPA